MTLNVIEMLKNIYYAEHHEQDGTRKNEAA